MKVKPLPNIDWLRSQLHYFPNTGLFCSPDDFELRLGTINSNGYIKFTLKDRNVYSAHRIAYYLFHNIEPDFIDHINGDKKDNRISNLRSVTASVNSRNQKLHRDNKSGFPGVRKTWRYNTFKYNAHINDKGKRIDLGCYDTIEDAIKAREIANKQYNYHENHGKR